MTMDMSMAGFEPVAAEALSPPGRPASLLSAYVNYSNSSQGVEEGSTASFAEHWVAHQLEQREEEFTHFESVEYDAQDIYFGLTNAFSVLLGTWNVNGKRPCDARVLAEWLAPEGVEPALVALSLQELDMSAQGVIFRENSALVAPWLTMFDAVLDKAGKAYTLLASKQLGGVLLVVYVAKRIEAHVREVSIATCITGVLGVLANKGGVAIRCRLHDSTFCFVGAHFNAHQGNVERRNQDYHDIVTSTVFEFGLRKRSLKILDHDNVYWLGDMNYRIDLPDDLVRQLIAQADWEALFAADQLHMQMQLGKAFVKWKELPLRFAPTYKYDTNSTEYDTSDKHRIPAWTDRVLYRSRFTDPLRYGRHEVLSSDHRPVSLTARVRVKTVDERKKDELTSDVVRDLDKLFNDTRPELQLSTAEFDFGHIYFGTISEKRLTLENKGVVVVRWGVRSSDEGNSQQWASWLHLEPSEGFIAPGEKADVTVSALVDKRAPLSVSTWTQLTRVGCAAHLEGKALREMLVLHVVNGKDVFLDFSAVYLTSCFGHALLKLVAYPAPVRTSLPHPTLRLLVPKELWRMCDWLAAHGMRYRHVFLEGGDQAQLELIRECLDTGADFGELHALSMGEALLAFLASLPTSVLPPQLYEAASEACHSFAACTRIVARLVDAHYATFTYVVLFLRELLSHSAHNALTPGSIGVNADSERVREEFLLQFLLSHNEPGPFRERK